jgi:2-desacetyl-2-hydroxyethyl bacteriochlorophyllide A dehydrogenase
VKAAILTRIPSDSLEVAEVDEPAIRPDELLLSVDACGICGTDLHILEGRSYRPSLPFILGHEPVGRVISTGSQADASWLGTRVAPTLFVGDGTCPYCQSGDERLCPNLLGITGVDRLAGGFARYLSLRTSQAVPVPTELTDAAAASLVDGGATAANAVRVLIRSLREAPTHVRGGLVVIIGAGPIGLLVAELVAREDMPLVVVQPSEIRRAVAKSMDHPVATTVDEVDGAISAVIDCAGAPGSLAWSVNRLQAHGVFVAAGYGLATGVEMAPVARKELTVSGVRSGRRSDLETIFALAAAGSIRLPPISTFSLDDINLALASLRSRTIPGKVVVDVRG